VVGGVKQEKREGRRKELLFSTEAAAAVAC
jgi:hypothetical protein